MFQLTKGTCFPDNFNLGATITPRAQNSEYFEGNFPKGIHLKKGFTKCNLQTLNE